MAVRVAINGFGRIGRLVLRAAYEHKHSEIEVVGVNDLGSVETNTHLLRYDSVHGRFPGEVTSGDSWMDIGRGKIRVTAERDPAKLPWRELGVDVALECTGIFTKRDAAAKHLEAGAKKAIISAPADGADLTVVMGVNHEELKSQHQVISNGSCTTNCLAPVAYVLHQGIGIERGFMTTIHAYTGDQSLQDTLHSDLHRARAAALSMIPTSTGAARAIGLVLPALKGKLDGTAIRVPTPHPSSSFIRWRTLSPRWAPRPKRGGRSSSRAPRTPVFTPVPAGSGKCCARRGKQFRRRSPAHCSTAARMPGQQWRRSAPGSKPSYLPAEPMSRRASAISRRKPAPGY